MNSTLQKLNWRYATKKFDPTKKLSEQQAEELTEAVRLTPTSYGLQPMRLINLQDKSLRNELLPAAFQQQQVIDASHLFVLCRLEEITTDFIEKYVVNISKTRNEPLDDMNLSAYKKTMMNILDWDTTEQVQWMKNQVYIALGNLLTVCAFEEIDACPMEGFDPLKVDEVLGLKSKGLKSVLLCPVGYRDTTDVFASKKKVRKSRESFVINM